MVPTATIATRGGAEDMFPALCRSARRLPRPRRIDVAELEARTLLSYVPFTPEFQVNPAALVGAATPDIADAADDAGNFVVAWTTDLGNGTFNVFAQQFSRDSTPLGGKITIAANIS